jgi:hypothetical protein
MRSFRNFFKPFFQLARSFQDFFETGAIQTVAPACTADADFSKFFEDPLLSGARCLRTAVVSISGFLKQNMPDLHAF